MRYTVKWSLRTLGGPLCDLYGRDTNSKPYPRNQIAVGGPTGGPKADRLFGRDTNGKAVLRSGGLSVARRSGGRSVLVVTPIAKRTSGTADRREADQRADRARCAGGGREAAW